MAVHTPSLSLTVLLLLISNATSTWAHSSADTDTTGEGDGVVKRAYHFPIYRRERASATHPVDGLVRRGTFTGAIGLGDYYDATYNVLVKIGNVEMPLVLDTGSSDIWAISDACTGPCAEDGIPVYPQASFQSSGIAAQLFYGDSLSGTHAFGLIGKDTAGVGGLTMSNQVFAAINSTNASVISTESAGIFGLGFPINSVLFHNLFNQQFPNHLRRRDDTMTTANELERCAPQSPAHPEKLKRAPVPKGKTKADESGRRIRPNVNSDPRRNDARTHAMHRKPASIAATLASFRTRQQNSINASSNTADLLSTFSSNGPLLARLVSAGQLKQPSITISLQRDTIHFGGNVGLLSIGELPDGVTNKSLTWAPIRRYSVLDGGIAGPPDAPNEVFPLAWEVKIDNVFLDGKALPNSTLAPGITNTALIDTGSSLIRGPSDVVSEIHSRIMGLGETYDCSVPHTLAFQIGGKLFPVDPRDFLFQAFHNRLDECTPNVVATDLPQPSFLYSWSLGDPFLKSVLASFYYGNLTRPSLDPPRIGFLSTVPNNAAALLAEAIVDARGNKNNFVSKFEPAPSGTFTPAGTGIGGVMLAPTAPTARPSSTSSSQVVVATAAGPGPSSAPPPVKPNGAITTRPTIRLSGLVSVVLGLGFVFLV